MVYECIPTLKVTFALQDKLDEMEKSVANPDLGSDLRGVKELLKKHQNLEMDLGSLADTIQSIISHGQEMADAGHFNSAGILSAVQDFNKRWGRGWSLCMFGWDSFNILNVSHIIVTALTNCICTVISGL